MNFLKKNKGTIFFSIFLIIILWYGYQYLFQAPTQIEKMEVSYTGSSSDFINILQSNPLEWNNKPVEISGKITEFVDNNFILDEFIFCQLKETQERKPPIKINSKITIKGIVIGYDELLNELKINQCIIKN